jgi:hypothetical protein
MRVNGFDLDPGNYQIAMECVSQPGGTVIRNCPNYEDAMVTLEILTNDPTSDLERVLKKPIRFRFHVLDWEGKTCHHAHFDHWQMLRGEELAMREIEWEFGHSKRVQLPVLSQVFVSLVAAVRRTIYHAFWLACYLCSFALVIGVPVLFLTVMWHWMLD